MTINLDTTGFDKTIGSLSKQLPYITMLALNNTAFAAQSDLKNIVKSSLKLTNQKMPNAFRVKKATKDNLEARTFVDEFSWQYKALVHHFEGGDRERKGTEKALQYAGVMGKDKILTPSGGIRINPSTYVRIMSFLKLNYKAGYAANLSQKSAARKRKDNTKYFIATKRDRKTSHLAEGIYARIGDGSSPQSILTISKKPAYDKRIDIDEVVQKTIDLKFNTFFNEAMIKAMKTSR